MGDGFKHFRSAEAKMICGKQLVISEGRVTLFTLGCQSFQECLSKKVKVV